MPKGFRQKLKGMFKGGRNESGPVSDSNDINRQLLALGRTAAEEDQSTQSFLALSMMGDTAGRARLERNITAENLQRPGETMQQTVERLQQEFVARYANMDPAKPSVPQGPDRISDLILTGRSDKPRMNAAGPNASVSDRRVADIEQRMEQLLNPPPQTHETFLVDTSQVDVFTYKPLSDRRAIRLLHFTDDEFQLVPGNAKQKVCTLRTYSPADVPEYLALSYVWDSPRLEPEYVAAYKETRDWYIVSEDAKLAKFRVGRNLFEALSRITKAKSDTRHIWIDSLCINQNDVAEKMSQVSFMDRIYTNCKRVVVWLGEMNPRDAAGIMILHFDIVPELAKYILQHGEASIQGGDWTEAHLQERFGIGRTSRAEDWRNYCNMFWKYSWFTRAWVLQEVALAPEAVVLFAHLSIPFMQMYLMAAFLGTSGLAKLIANQYAIDSTDKLPPGVALEVFHKSQQMAKALRSPDGPHFPWKAFLLSTTILRTLQSKDPRDRIYAALGFLQVDRRYIGQIVPDYNIDPHRVFQNTTELFLRELPNLEILGHREITELRDTSMPSWVPDFTKPPGTMSMEDDTYDASRCKSQAPMYRLEGSTLVLHGRAIGAVQVLRHIDMKPQSGEIGVKILDAGFSSVEHLTAVPSPWSKDPLEVLWRTLIADQTTSAGTPEIDHSYFRCFVAETFIKCFEDNPHLNTDYSFEGLGGIFPPSPSKPTPDFLRSLSTARGRVRTSLYPDAKDMAFCDEVAKKSGVFASKVGTCAVNRCLFVLESGMVGPGPVSMKQEDVVMYVESARVPFAMRRIGSTFELIGEVYLHGYMYGELVDMGFKQGLHEIRLV